MTAVQERTWTTVCRYADLLPGRGVAALLPGGEQVALFRTEHGLHVLSNHDPFSCAAVLSRGIAGLAGQTLIINLPGSTGGVRDGMAVLSRVLPHAIDQARGGDHPRQD